MRRPHARAGERVRRRALRARRPQRRVLRRERKPAHLGREHLRYGVRDAACPLSTRGGGRTWDENICAEGEARPGEAGRGGVGVLERWCAAGQGRAARGATRTSGPAGGRSVLEAPDDELEGAVHGAVCGVERL